MPAPSIESRFARNTLFPESSDYRAISAGQSIVAARMRKMVFCKHFPVNNVPAPSMGENAILSTFMFRAGILTTRVRGVFYLAPRTEVDISNPNVQMFLDPVSGGGATSGTILSPATDTTSPSVPAFSQDIIRAELTLDVLPGELYRGVLAGLGNVRIWSAMVYELHDEVLESDMMGASNPTVFERDAQIRDFDISQTIQQGADLFSSNAGHLMQYSPLRVRTISATTPTNVYDGSTVANAQSIGHTLDFTNLARRRRPLRLELGIAADTTGTAQLNVRLQTASGTLLSVVHSGALFANSTFHDITFNGETKVDLQAWVTGAGTAQIRGIGLWPNEGTP